MIRIALCDDEMHFRQIEEKVIKDIFHKHHVTEYEIRQFDRSKKILEKADTTDILILDIDMPDMDGLELKNYLEYVGTDIKIIFVTNHEEHMKEAFGSGVFGFVGKAGVRKELEVVLLHLLEIMQKRVLIENQFLSTEIIYIKSAHIYSELYMKDQTRNLVRIDLKNLEEELAGAGFIRTHRSYLVNMQYMEGKVEKQIRVSGQMLPVSVRRLKEVKEKYKEYCRKHGGYR